MASSFFNIRKKQILEKGKEVSHSNILWKYIQEKIQHRDIWVREACIQITGTIQSKTIFSSMNYLIDSLKMWHNVSH